MVVNVKIKITFLQYLDSYTLGLKDPKHEVVSFAILEWE